MVPLTHFSEAVDQQKCHCLKHITLNQQDAHVPILVASMVLYRFLVRTNYFALFY